MGAAASSMDPRHVRIWNNLSSLESATSRIQMIETLLAGPEYVAAAKRANLYAALLSWIAAQRRGEFCPWPATYAASAPAPAPRQAARIEEPPRLRIVDVPIHASTRSGTIAIVPAPKRAMDVLHESYRTLNIDDTKPLTHEVLRAAYKRAAIRAHPDKGGNPEAFDAVTRSFLYIDEILNKLIPKTAADGSDPRFTASVNPETAMRARGVNPTAPAPAGTPQLENAPPIALNPKKLDMSMFNKLFEENKLPDPDGDDGYGDWLKTADERGPAQAMRGKYNKDVFNKTFEDEARRQGGASQTALSAYKPPSEITLAPTFGTEIGGGRPTHYTKPPSSGGIGYTDLKFAYGEGSTFSQDVGNVSLDGRPKNLEEAKREYGTAPRALSADEAAACAAFDRAKLHAEEQRQRRAAAQDVNSETLHNRLKSRLMIQS
jgi:hypothetical protein